MRGYWEDDEFKAPEITLLATDQIIVLRDGWGRPVWSGSAQNGRSAQEVKLENNGDGSAAAGNAGQRVGWGGNGRGGADD